MFLLAVLPQNVSSMMTHAFDQMFFLLALVKSHRGNDVSDANRERDATLAGMFHCSTC